MTPLALAGDDLPILLGMLLSVAAAVFLAATATRYAAKAGFVLAGALLCLGFAYFGWRPLFGSFDAESAFGCVCLMLGLLSVALFRLLDGSPRPRSLGVPVAAKAEEDRR